MSIMTFRWIALSAMLLIIGATTTRAETPLRLIPSWSTTSSAAVLYAFKGVPDGATSLGGLIADTRGALYGTTSNGGVESSLCPGLEACGTVFKLSPTRTGYTESILYRFLRRD